MGCSDEAPLAKGGCLGNAEAGGFRRLAGFHIGLYFEKVPAQPPLAREPLGCSDEAPLAKGGCLGNAEAGGFPRLAGFHIGLYFEKVPAVNPSVTATPCQLPLAREPLGFGKKGAAANLSFCSGILYFL